MHAELIIFIWKFAFIFNTQVTIFWFQMGLLGLYIIFLVIFVAITDPHDNFQVFDKFWCLNVCISCQSDVSGKDYPVECDGLASELCIAQHPNICLLVQHLSELSLTFLVHSLVNLTQNTFQNFHGHEIPSAWHVLLYFIYLVSFYSAVKTNASVCTCFVLLMAFLLLPLGRGRIYLLCPKSPCTHFQYIALIDWLLFTGLFWL